MKACQLLILFYIFNACTSNINKKVEPIFNYDLKNRILTLYLDSVDLTQINLISKRGSQQQIQLDSSLKIDVIKNVINSPIETNYVNTWVKLDKQGNVDYSKTYDYEAYPVIVNEKPYIECYQSRSLTKGKKYILLNDFDENFNPVSNAISDTIFFNSKYFALIPISQPKKGINKIRFLIVEESNLKGNVLEMRTTYVDKDFYIK